MDFLIGTYRRRESKGIYMAKLTKDTLTSKSHLIASLPSYLVWHDNIIFSIHKFGIEIFKDNIAIYKSNNELNAPAHINYHNKHKFIFTVNYHTGELLKYRFNDENTEIVESINYGEKSHPHQAFIDNDFDILYVPLLGRDQIKVYKINELSLKELKTIKLPSGFGPRHLVKYRDHLIVAGELSRSVCVIDSDGNVVFETKKYTNGTGSGFSAIRLHPKKKIVYVANREDNSIISFNITDGFHLTELEIVKEDYEHARDFNITPDGKHLIVGYLHSDIIILYNINKDGLLVKTDLITNVYEPTCISFNLGMIK